MNNSIILLTTIFVIVSIGAIVAITSRTKIGDYAYYRKSMSEFTVPHNITEIGDSVFSGCTSMSKIMLPLNLTKIVPYAFQNCTSLVEIVLPPNLTEIGPYAFKGCTSLRKITLPLTLPRLYLTPSRIARPWSR